MNHQKALIKKINTYINQMDEIRQDIRTNPNNPRLNELTDISQGFIENNFFELGFITLPEINLRQFESTSHYSSNYFDKYYFHPVGLFLRINYCVKEDNNKANNIVASSYDYRILGLKNNNSQYSSSSSPIVTQYGITIFEQSFTGNISNYGTILGSFKTTLKDMNILEQLEEAFVDEFDPFYITLLVHGKNMEKNEQYEKSKKFQVIKKFFMDAPDEFKNYLNIPFPQYLRSIINAHSSKGLSHVWDLNISDERSYLKHYQYDDKNTESDGDNVNKKPKKIKI